MQRLSFLFLILFSIGAMAFQDTLESGELVEPGKYKIGIAPQLSPLNATVFFDSNVNEESSVRFLAGSGNIDFYTGAVYKWIPIPDYGNQPAIGARIGASYYHKDSSYFDLRLEPLVSKKWKYEDATFIPYVTLPFNFVAGNGTTDLQDQLVGGSEFISPEYPNVSFGAELGVNVRHSLTYVAGYVTILLDAK